MLLVLALGIALALSYKFTPSDNPVPPPPVGRVLEVHNQGGPGIYRNLQAAVNAAGPNDRIVVNVHLTEIVHIKDKHSLTIEAARTVTWSPPPFIPKGPPQQDPLLTIQDCSDVAIRGFTLDGDPKGVRDCVHVWGKCPGVTLEKLQLKNFNRCGVLIANCEGSAENPVKLSELKFTPKTNVPPPIGILFDLEMPQSR